MSTGVVSVNSGNVMDAFSKAVEEVRFQGEMLTTSINRYLDIQETAKREGLDLSAEFPPAVSGALIQVEKTRGLGG